MRPLLHPTLVNDPFGDPGLYVDCRYQRWAIQFDLGDLHALPARKLLRIRDVFVSHAHIDHFIGFDQLLRVLVGRDQTVRLHGPAGILDQVGHRLAGYSWNLVDRYAADLAFIVTEVRSPGEAVSATFRFKNRFRREDERAVTLTDGVLGADSGFRVRCAILDHRLPCLGFAVEEDLHVNVHRNRLEALGLPVGPWLREAKQAVLAGAPDDTPCRVRWQADGEDREREVPLGTVRREAMAVVPGQKLGYVVDVAHTEENVKRIVELVGNADLLFIEASFARCDADLAEDRAHLTTEQAGRIARLAGAKRVEPFHFSARYAGEGERMREEVHAAFAGEPDPAPAVPAQEPSPRRRA